MKRALLLLSLFATSLFANNLDPIITMENEPLAVIEGKVNVITGDLIQYEEDYVIEGVEPIRIGRSFTNGGCADWIIIPQAFICSGLSAGKKDGYKIYDRNGSLIHYGKFRPDFEVMIDGEKYSRWDPINLEWGYCNTSHGSISARTNLKNNYLLVRKKNKEGMPFYVHSADGTIRKYSNDRLISERLPNGNQVIYEYADNPKKNIPSSHQLLSIRTTNPAGDKTFARADFFYDDPKGKNKHFYIKGSDGQEIEYQFEGGKQSGNLQKVIPPCSPEQSIQYTFVSPPWLNPNALETYYVDSHLIDQIELPLNRKLKFNYYSEGHHQVGGQKIHIQDKLDKNGDIQKTDQRKGKVKSLSFPLGSDGSLKETTSLIYDFDKKKTTVYDFEGKRVDYFYDLNYRLLKIERYGKNGQLQNFDHFVWGKESDVCNLICKTMFDSNSKPVASRRYIYDAKGNIVENRFYGNLSGQGSSLSLDGNGLPIDNGVEVHTIKYRYSPGYLFGEMDLLLEEEHDSGLRIVHEYFPGTDLPTSQLTYDKSDLKLRKFWEYDKDHLLVREITDDGVSTNKGDLSGVKSRKIRQIARITEGSYLGMPKRIEEKTWDPASGESLLKRTDLAYGIGATIEQKEVYDADGQFSHREKISYDQKRRPIEQTNALGQSKKIVYDACNNPISIIDFSGRSVAYLAYDFLNQPASIVKYGDDGIVESSNIAYNAGHQKISEVGPYGHSVLYEYNEAGHLSKKKLHDRVFQYFYDPLGRMTQEVDPNGSITKTSYNTYNKPIRIEYPDGGVETFLYNLDGTLRTSTDPKGVLTSYSYDAFGRQISKSILYQGETLSQEIFEYDAFQLIRETDPEGNRKAFIYDSAGRLTAKEFEGERTEFKYDALGRQILEVKEDLYSHKVYDRLDRVIEERSEDDRKNVLTKVAYSYDSFGNQSSITRFVNDAPATETFSYDSMNRLRQKTDPMGHQTTIKYEEIPTGLRETNIDPMGLTTIREYNAHDLPVSLKLLNKSGRVLREEERLYDYRGSELKQISRIFDPIRTIHLSKEYDSMGRLVRMIEAAGTLEERTTSHSYDQSGHLIETRKPDGTSLYYQYSPLGRLSSLSSSDGTVSYTYSYDRLGRMKHSTDSNTGQTTLRTYDPQGHLIQETLGNGCTLTSLYDNAGRRNELLLPDSSSVRYGYDSCHLRTIERCEPSGYTLYRHEIVSYDLSGKSQEERLIGELGALNRTYNANGDATRIASSYLSHEILDRDAIGNILHSQLDGISSTYQYDDLYQLISESGAFRHGYQFDAQNCRLQKDEETYQFNDLLEIPSHLSYDKNGNPLQQKDIRYSYDALDRLIVVETPFQRVEFTYDSDHRRLTKTVFSLQDGFWQKTDERRFLYDRQNEIGSVSPSGEIEELRVLAATPSAEIGAAVAVELRGKIYAPVHDIQGNIAALISLDTKQREASYRYSAFGEEIATGTLASPWRYSSKRFDPETNLTYYGRRYYSADLGRWMTLDPAGYIDGINRYAFVHNNPLNHWDLYGLLDANRQNFSFTFDYPKIQSPFSGFTNNPRVQGCMQAFSGLVETGVGGGMTLWSVGIAAPIGLPVMAHGLDHFFTGMGTAITGRPRETATFQLLQKTGMSPQTAGLADASMSIVGGMGGTAAVRTSAVFMNEFRAARVIGTIPEEVNFINTAAKEVAGIRGFVIHGVDRAIYRGVSPKAILDALKKPLKIKDIKFDFLGRPSQRLIGRNAEVVINPVTKKVISVNQTSTRKAEKLLEELGGE
jgi:RHS repeat-associated protein